MSDVVVPTAVLGTILVLLLLAAAPFLIRYARRLDRERDAAWDAAARALGGDSRLRKAGGATAPRRIDARIDLVDAQDRRITSVDVQIDHDNPEVKWTDGSMKGDPPLDYTRLQADAPLSGGLRMRIYPRTKKSRMPTTFGIELVPTGDQEFDERFVVEANDEGLAHSWLTRRVRDAIWRTAGYSFGIEDGALTARRGHFDTNVERLQAAALATVELAGAGRALLDRWERLAKTLQGVLGDGEGFRWIEIEEQGVPLRIDTTAAGPQSDTVTCVRARVAGSAAERYELLRAGVRPAPNLTKMPEISADLPGSYVVASSAPKRTARRLDGPLKQRLAQLAPLRIESDGDDVTVALLGVEVDERRLRDAMDLARALAASSEGPYR